MARQICVSSKEFRPTRGRPFGVGDRIMFRCEWWTVVGIFFAPKAQSLEKIYILQEQVTHEEEHDARVSA